MYIVERLSYSGRLDLIHTLKTTFSITIKIFQTKKVKKFRDCALVLFYEDGTKFQILSENIPLLHLFLKEFGPIVCLLRYKFRAL